MKKTYTKPVVEVTTWANSDVITSSGYAKMTLVNSASDVTSDTATVVIDYSKLK